MEISAQVDLARIEAAFGDEAPNWLGQPAGADAGGLHRYLCDLELRVSPDGRATFRKSAIVSIGRPRRRGDEWIVPIEWRAASLAPMFPVLAGHMSIGADRIAHRRPLRPPFGVIGYVLDRAILSIAARGTASWFIAKVAGVAG